MNVLGHTFVALAVGDDDPAYVLGAVLPDLAPMLNVRIDRSRLDGRVGEGVRCHIEADAVFHGLAEFRSGAAALRRSHLGRRTGARAPGPQAWGRVPSPLVPGRRRGPGQPRRAFGGRRA